MKESKYTKALTKIQVGAIFHAREIRRIFLPTFIDIFTIHLYGDAMLVPIRMVTNYNMATGNQQKHVSRSCAT